MGCLNSNGKFPHVFGNIHLSGPCNRSCYFCIGQHMMGLDHLNVLDKHPLDGLDKFIDACLAQQVKEINVTGSNTDPLLYTRWDELYLTLERKIPYVSLGIRTNGIYLDNLFNIAYMLDRISISLTSLDDDVSKRTMGGSPPNLNKIKEFLNSQDKYWTGPQWNKDVKINIVLCPELFEEKSNVPDLYWTIMKLVQLGVFKINIREPYGQPHLGTRFSDFMSCKFPLAVSLDNILGMPRWQLRNTVVTYWDVHYVEVESINLYANGVISTTYPVTKGYDPVLGKVEGQEHFNTSGRIREQWVTLKCNTN